MNKRHAHWGIALVLPAAMILGCQKEEPSVRKKQPLEIKADTSNAPATLPALGEVTVRAADPGKMPEDPAGVHAVPAQPREVKVTLTPTTKPAGEVAVSDISSDAAAPASAAPKAAAPETPAAPEPKVAAPEPVPAAAPAEGLVAPGSVHVMRAQALVDKGLEFLKTQQQPDGGFQVGQDPPAVTAIALKAIVQSPKYDASTDWVKKAYDKLLSHQMEDGGIYKDLLANYNTAIAVSALAAAENPAFEERIDRATAYLKGLQWTEKTGPGPKGETVANKDNPWYGGAGYGRHGRPDGSNTQLMLDALKDAGVAADDPAFQASIVFMSRMQNRSESNNLPWTGEDGGAVYTPANNGESQAGEYMSPDGKRMLRSYGSMTYAMLKSFIYAGVKKDDARVKAAFDWIKKNWTLDENPGMRTADPANADYGLYYYYHTVGRALNAYDEPTITDAKGQKHDWRLELIAKLESLQKSNGSWEGNKKWMEDKPVLATSYAVLALQEAIADLKEHPAK